MQIILHVSRNKPEKTQTHNKAVKKQIKKRQPRTHNNSVQMWGFSKSQVALGAAVAVVGAVALYRNIRNFTKPKQATDQPLTVWVNNTDYDESFACDFLSASPRVVAVYLARAAFWPTLYWTGLKAMVSKSNRWMDRIDDHVILGEEDR